MTPSSLIWVRPSGPYMLLTELTEGSVATVVSIALTRLRTAGSPSEPWRTRTTI
jgi:hypothetical protein